MPPLQLKTLNLQWLLKSNLKGVISLNYSRLNGETDLELLARIAAEKDTTGMTWDQIGAEMNRITNSSVGESTWRKRLTRNKFACVDRAIANKNEPTEEEDKIRELKKERMKLQSEKVEYNRWLREEGRDELIVEKICSAISTLPPLKIPKELVPEHNKKSYLLTISDAHYGVEFEIKDFYGQTLNKYSPEIFEERMEYLYYQVVEKIKQLDIKELTIMELGDGIDGLLRSTSQLMKLRYGVIESSIRYAYILANWINNLSQYTRIKFQMVMDSNHNQLRLLNGKKNAFPDENMAKVMWVLIKEVLKDNPNVVFNENPTGYPYAIMSTYCVVGLHGEKKNLKNNLLEMSHLYGIHIDYTVSGHMHHEMMNEIGFDSAVLSVGSIIGVDSYSMSLNATSNASCSMFEFEQGKGRTAEYVFKLN